MITPKIFRSKKAISPILATLLLVVIAVSAIVMTYAWMTQYMDDTTDKITVSPYEANVAFLDKGKTIQIDIGNSGSADTNIIGVYIGLDDSNATPQKTTPVSPLALKADSITSFKVTYTWNAGETYYFKIATESGIEPLTFQEEAPQ
jgi:archaeal type IV pilus assembly protein PilA